MKRFFACVLLALTSAVFGATLSPVQLLNPAGSTSGQVITSTGPSTAPAWGGLGLNGIAAIAGNTVLANATNLTASPAAFVMPSCSTTTSALQYTSGTGFTCFSGSAPLASPTFTGIPAAPTAAVDTNTTQVATTAYVVGQGYLKSTTAASTYAPLASPALTGTPTAPTATAGTATTQLATTQFAQTAVTGGGNAGSFTTLAASGNDAMTYTNTSAQSIPNNALTAVTTWTKTFDRVNANFNASTGTFTAPTTGIYHVEVGLVYSASGSAAINNAYQVFVVANGATACATVNGSQTTTSVVHAVSASCDVSLSAGQTVIIDAFQNSGAAVTLSSSAGVNYLSIHRVP